MSKKYTATLSEPPSLQAARPFHLATAMSAAPETAQAVEELALRLGADADRPDFVTIHYGSARAPEDVWRHATKYFSTHGMHGASSCLGVMCNEGAAIDTGNGIGVLAIWDPEGAYGTASAALGSAPRLAAARATREALRRAGRAGEAPELVWLTSAPGNEELVLEGIKDVIGRPAQIIGASAADNDVTGTWSQLSGDGIAQDAVVVSVMFPSVPFACTFESGYIPTEKHGTVTRASGRILTEIDGRPAADVYAEWTGLAARPKTGMKSILADAAMFPLGRISSEFEGVPFHLLAHPAVAHADGRLELFADIPQGEEIWLMSASHDNLVQRAGRIAAASRKQLPGDVVTGGLMVYCGGCMLSVSDRMDEVARGVSESLDGVPFLGVFSFGEQGETFDGDSEHGNLMISCIAFGGAAKRAKAAGSQGRK